MWTANIQRFIDLFNNGAGYNFLGGRMCFLKIPTFDPFSLSYGGY